MKVNDVILWFGLGVGTAAVVVLLFHHRTNSALLNWLGLIVAGLALGTGVAAVIVAHQDVRRAGPGPDEDQSVSGTGIFDLDVNRSNITTCRYRISGRAQIPRDQGLAVSTTRTDVPDAQSSFESSIHWNDGRPETGRWTADITFEEPGTYTVDLVTMPGPLAAYLATVMKKEDPGNRHWAGDGLPPYAERLDRIPVTRSDATACPDQ